MNLLSVLSTIIYTSFFIGAWYVLNVERKNSLNLSACAVLVSLGWWSFCNSFFYAAVTQEQAWFWHKLSSIGWCGFVALTAYYFVVLTNRKQKVTSCRQRFFFFAPAVVLICKNIFGKTSSLAQAMIPSGNGWGWTYENSLTSFWLWAYLLYVAVYFGIAFVLLYQWAKSAKHKMKQELAILFILLDTITILCGLFSDVILPLTNPGLPALASVATAVFGVGYFTIIVRYDLFNINLVISADDILQTGNNSIFVIDENQEILKYNRAVKSLLGYSQSELMGTNFMMLAAEPIEFRTLHTGEELINLEAKLRCRDGILKDVLLSAAVAKDKRNSFLCIIVSCQDVSKQKRVQEELAEEREKYKKLADEYHLLAYFDPLTSLPNRRQLLDTLSVFEKRHQTKGKDFAVIFLDLDNFKHANDVYGHSGGDELLIAAARKLQACVEREEFVARLGGDEFMLILPCTQTEAVVCKMQEIREEFLKKILFRGDWYEIRISAGYGIFSQAGDQNKLMQLADEAMYGNKKRTISESEREG